MSYYLFNTITGATQSCQHMPPTGQEGNSSRSSLNLQMKTFQRRLLQAQDITAAACLTLVPPAGNGWYSTKSFFPTDLDFYRLFN